MKKRTKYPQSRKTDAYARYRNQSIFLCIVILIVFFLFFRNNLRESIYVEAAENSLVITAYTGESVTVSYDSLISVSLSADTDLGEMLSGDENLRARCGIWKNESWGKYRLYALKNVSSYIALETADGIIVFNYESDSVTNSIYTAIQTLMEQKGLSGQIAFQTDIPQEETP